MGTPRTLIFTSTGTWTCPGGVTDALVLVWGGGGAGAGGGMPGGQIDNQHGGEGGGGGLFASANVTVIPGIAYDIQINPGGGSDSFGSGDELIQVENGHAGGSGGGHGQGGNTVTFGANTRNHIFSPGGNGGRSTDTDSGGGGGGGGGSPPSQLVGGTGINGGDTATDEGGDGGPGGGGGGGGVGGSGGKYGSAGVFGGDFGGGGGGGGGFDDDGDPTAGTNGGAGKVVLYYTIPCEVAILENGTVEDCDPTELTGVAEDPEQDDPIISFSAAGAGLYYYQAATEVGLGRYDANANDFIRGYQETSEAGEEQHVIYVSGGLLTAGLSFLCGNPFDEVEGELFSNLRITPQLVADHTADAMKRLGLQMQRVNDLKRIIGILQVQTPAPAAMAKARADLVTAQDTVEAIMSELKSLTNSGTQAEKRAAQQVWLRDKGRLPRPGSVRVSAILGAAALAVVVYEVLLENPNIGNSIVGLGSPRPTLQNTGLRMQGRLSITGDVSEALNAHNGRGRLLYLAPIDGVDEAFITMRHRTSTSFLNNLDPQDLVENWKINGVSPLDLGADSPGLYLPQDFFADLGTAPDGSNRTKLSNVTVGIPVDIFCYVAPDSYNRADPSKLRLWYANWDSEMVRGHSLAEATYSNMFLVLDTSVSRFFPGSYSYQDMHVYLGTILPISPGVTGQGPNFRFIWNKFNPLRATDAIEDKDSVYWLVNPLGGAGQKSPMNAGTYGWRYYFLDPQDGSAPSSIGSGFPIVKRCAVTGYGPVGVQIKHYDALGGSSRSLYSPANPSAKDEAVPGTDGKYSYTALNIRDVAGYQHSGGLNCYKVAQYVLPGVEYPENSDGDRVKYGYFGTGQEVPIGDRGIWEEECDGTIRKRNPAGTAIFSVLGAF